ncbi:uncharacterized protein LOC106645025 [Copidosoma floridanum]|uniref:uncharacterized protein LOC106645025 n=1 Tax=Copidosoma floridanum TaxID=29053 RepID=UPI0006C97191|nr:uncharacterized protein LOC106645025 [Copidosoma floridanum]
MHKGWSDDGTKLDWDTPVTDQLLNRWLCFRGELSNILMISVPQWLGVKPDASWHLHGFADASKQAYAAVIFAVTPGGESMLLLSKTKVSPIRVVLEWLKNHSSRWPTFIVNRTSEILSSFPKATWRAIQQSHFTEEKRTLLAGSILHKRSCLRRLNLFICEQGLLRVGGRLHYAPLSEGEKHPIILPGSCKLVKWLIQETHMFTLHGGPQLTISVLNTSFWITQGLRAATSAFHHCVTCTRYAAKGTKQIMGQLPTARVTPTRPFAATDLDYAGPVPVLFSKGRGAKSTKGYIAIFIRMITRAIHIEIVSDLSSEAFLAALAHFCARRGTCSVIFSDNATTFKGASSELDRLFQQSSNFTVEVNDQLSTKGIKWSFIPPRAPHFVGLREAAVRSFKHHFRRVVGDATLTFKELSTLAAKIEACLNSRPLCPLASDPLAPTTLTPAHFLTGSPQLSYPEPYSNDNAVPKYVSRWRLLNQMRNSFWTRWKKKVLHQFQLFNKWQTPQLNLQVGDIVLLKDQLSPPSKWPLDLIIDIYPGDDGLVRIATIKTASAIFKRPVIKLIKLPTEADFEDCLSRKKEIELPSKT